MSQLLAGLDPNQHFFISLCAGAAQVIPHPGRHAKPSNIMAAARARLECCCCPYTLLNETRDPVQMNMYLMIFNLFLPGQSSLMLMIHMGSSIAYCGLCMPRQEHD